MLELLPPAARKVPGLKRRGEGLGLRDHHDQHDDDQYDHDDCYFFANCGDFLMYQLCVLQIVTPNHFLQDIVKSHVTYGGLN